MSLALDEALLQLQRAEAAERIARARADALAKKAERLQADEVAARLRADQLERDLLLAKQQIERTVHESERTVAEAQEMHRAECDALRQSLFDTEAKLEAVRVMERSKFARIEELEAQFANASQRLEVSARKRARPSDGVGEDDVAALQRRVRELEAQNEALQSGAVASARMQQLLDQASEAQRAARRVEAELEKANRARLALAEEVNATGELRARYELAKKQVEELSQGAAERDAMANECRQWREALGCSSPSAASRLVADLQRQCALLQVRVGEIDAALVLAQSNKSILEARISELQTNVSRVEADKAEISEQLQVAQHNAAMAEGQRQAAERLIGVADTPEGVDERVALLSRSLEAAREESRQLKVSLEQALAAATSKATPAVSSEAVPGTRILHVKPAARADQQHSQVRELPSATKDSAGKDALGDSLRSQRLKEVFQKQIQLYKDAVFVLMGFKVDMTPEAKPQVRVRSMYAESPNDYLLFRYDPDNSSVVLLQTEFTKSLDSKALTFLTSCGSAPAFLASLSLSLFEKQTFAM